MRQRGPGVMGHGANLQPPRVVQMFPPAGGAAHCGAVGAPTDRLVGAPPAGRGYAGSNSNATQSPSRRLACS